MASPLSFRPFKGGILVTVTLPHEGASIFIDATQWAFIVAACPVGGGPAEELESTDPLAEFRDQVVGLDAYRKWRDSEIPDGLGVAQASPDPMGTERDPAELGVPRSSYPLIGGVHTAGYEDRPVAPPEEARPEAGAYQPDGTGGAVRSEAGEVRQRPDEGQPDDGLLVQPLSKTLAGCERECSGHDAERPAGEHEAPSGGDR